MNIAPASPANSTWTVVSGQNHSPPTQKSVFCLKSSVGSRLRSYPNPVRIPNHCTSIKPILVLNRRLYKRVHVLPPIASPQRSKTRSVTPENVPTRSAQAIPAGSGKRTPGLRPPAITPCRTFDEGTSPMSPMSPWKGVSQESPVFA